MEKSRIKGRNETSVSSFSSPVPYGKDTHFPCIEGRGGGRWLARARTLGVLLGVTASLCDICDLSGRTTRIHGHRWSSEEEEEEKNFFLNFAILSLLSLSSFFIRRARKDTGGTKDLRIFSFVETSISLLRGAFFFGTYTFACTVLLGRSNQRVPRFRWGIGTVFSLETPYSRSNIVFLGEGKSIKRNALERCSRDGVVGFWIYIYNVMQEKYSLILTRFLHTFVPSIKFSIKKINL